MGDYDGGIEQWKALLEYYPDSLFVLWNIAYEYLIEYRPEEAIPYIERGEQIEPDDCRMQILRSEIHIQNGEYDQARDLLGSITTDDPCMIGAVIRQAVVNYYLGDHDASEKYTQICNDLLRDNPRRWWALYYLYSTTKQEDQLYECIVSGTHDDPTSAAPWVALAKFYEDKNEHERAMDAWIKSFELRGYVKFHCSSCQTQSRTQYNPSYYDLNETYYCENCNSPLNIPTHLAKY